MAAKIKTVDKDFLKFYRNKNGLPPSKLVELTDYSDINAVEFGKVVLSYDDTKDRAVIKRIAKVLKIKPEQLFCLDEKSAKENTKANKCASKNLRAIRRIRDISETDVGISLGFSEKRAVRAIIRFERESLIFPPDELTRLAAKIFTGDSDKWRELQKEFLTRIFTSAEIEHIYSDETIQANLQQENKADEHEDASVLDDGCTSPENDNNAEYELHLADGRVISVKGSRNSIDVAYEFYIARKKVMLEYVKDDGSIFICRKKDIFYITRKGDER